MFDFSGRERRRQFWSSMAFVLIIAAFLGAVIGVTLLIQHLSRKPVMIGGNSLVLYEQGAFALIGLILFFPVVSSSVRRLHDVNVSGFLLLIPVVNIIAMCLPTSLKERNESSGFRHGFGQMLVLLIFTAAAGFLTLTFMGRLNGFRLGQFQGPVQEGKDVTEGDKNAARESTEKKAPEGNSMEKADPANTMNGNANLLEAGAVVIPIYDKNRLNYTKQGEEELPDGTVATRYRHVQSLTIDSLSNPDIYDSFGSQTVIGHVNTGDEYTVRSLIQITKPLENDHTGTFWVEIDYGKDSGYINAGRIDNPYRNDNYAPIEQIQIGSVSWTLRRFDTMFTCYHPIDIRDYPGLEGTKVIGRIDATMDSPITVRSDAITEEDDTSDSPIAGEPWVRIECDGLTGWIPGAHADTESNAIRHQTPDGILRNDLGLGI